MRKCPCPAGRRREWRRDGFQTTETAPVPISVTVEGMDDVRQHFGAFKGAAPDSGDPSGMEALRHGITFGESVFPNGGDPCRMVIPSKLPHH